MKERPLSVGILITIFASIFQVIVFYISPSIYVPLLVCILFSFYYGIISPAKGWLLAFIQIAIIIGGYWLGQFLGYTALKPQEASFGSHVIIFPSLVASFLASFVFRKR